MAMKVIEKHNLTETVLTQILGWKWMSYIGTPVKGTPGYPAKQRVRQLFSPNQLRTAGWSEVFEQAEGREADMTEPLDYCYCSSAGPAIPPRIFILVDDR